MLVSSQWKAYAAGSTYMPSSVDTSLMPTTSTSTDIATSASSEMNPASAHSATAPIARVQSMRIGHVLNTGGARHPAARSDDIAAGDDETGRHRRKAVRRDRRATHGTPVMTVAHAPAHRLEAGGLRGEIVEGM